MGEQNSITLIQSLYDAFGRGDITTIVKAMDKDVDWQSMAPASLPWSGPRRSPREVEKFFSDLTQAVDYQQLEPKEFLGSGERVAVLGTSSCVVRSTGRAVEQSWGMVWRVQDGGVTHWRYFDESSRWLDAMGLGDRAVAAAR